MRRQTKILNEAQKIKKARKEKIAKKTGKKGVPMLAKRMSSRPSGHFWLNGQKVLGK